MFPSWRERGSILKAEERRPHPQRHIKTNTTPLEGGCASRNALSTYWTVLCRLPAKPYRTRPWSVPIGNHAKGQRRFMRFCPPRGRPGGYRAPTASPSLAGVRPAGVPQERLLSSSDGEVEKSRPPSAYRRGVGIGLLSTTGTRPTGARTWEEMLIGGLKGGDRYMSGGMGFWCYSTLLPLWIQSEEAGER